MGTLTTILKGGVALDVYSCDMAETIISNIEKEARSIVPDMSTQEGRDAIKSNAYNVRRSKAVLEKIGKALKEEILSESKLKVETIDAERNLFKTSLAELSAEVREPLTKYEEAEAARIQSEKDAEELLEHHAEAKQMDELFNREREIARKEAEQAAKEQERLEKEEAAKAKAEQEERERKIAADATEDAKRKAEAQARAKEAEVEEERLKAVKQQIQAEEKMKQAEQDKVAAEERAKVQAENAERQAKESAEQARHLEIYRQEEEKRKEEVELAEREANKQHVSRVRGKAKEALMKYVDEVTAKKIVLAITNDYIPYVTINY